MIDISEYESPPLSFSLSSIYQQIKYFGKSEAIDCQTTIKMSCLVETKLEVIKWRLVVTCCEPRNISISFILRRILI